MKKRRGPGRPRKPKPPRRNLTRDLLYRINELDKFFRAQFADPNPARRYLSYSGLMEKFGWGKNTVIKDIATMQLTYSAPLEFIEERGGWGYTRSVANLPTILMSEGDLTVLCASWGALERRHKGEWEARVRPVVEKLMKAMGQGFSFDFATISERIAFRSSGYQDALDIHIFETVVTAVLSQHELRFVYEKMQDDGTPAPPEDRHVQPRCIVCADNAWYLLADDPTRDDDIRTFALARMDTAENTAQPFTPTRPFNLDELLRDCIGIHRGGEVADVEVHFHRSSARLARESYWHATQKFSTAPDGRLCLKMRVAMNPELEARILRYGPKAEVIEPQKLRNKFTEYAAEFAHLYLRSKVAVPAES